VCACDREEKSATAGLFYPFLNGGEKERKKEKRRRKCNCPRFKEFLERLDLRPRRQVRIKEKRKRKRGRIHSTFYFTTSSSGREKEREGKGKKARDTVLMGSKITRLL